VIGEYAAGSFVEARTIEIADRSSIDMHAGQVLAFRPRKCCKRWWNGRTATSRAKSDPILPNRCRGRSHDPQSSSSSRTDSL